ncbi:MAG: hypothetical protein IJM72_01395 [Deltaproteobacteria bacterium]|nr:hypothetical protein [Deltaproteobacteria bacterium]
MSEEQEKARLQIAMDPNNLYREEMFTDFKVGRIKQLTPIRADGGPDSRRKTLFIGETQVRTNSGDIVPVQCDIEARHLMEALEKFPEAIGNQMEKMIEEAKELKRQRESRILVPN